MTELQYLLALIVVYNNCPAWVTLDFNRAAAKTLADNLVSAGLAEYCRMQGQVRVPDLNGNFIRLTNTGTEIVSRAVQLLPDDLRS